MRIILASSRFFLPQHGPEESAEALAAEELAKAGKLPIEPERAAARGPGRRHDPTTEGVVAAGLP